MLKGPRLNLSGLSWLDHVLSMGSYLTLIQIAYLGSLTPSPTPTHMQKLKIGLINAFFLKKILRYWT